MKLIFIFIILTTLCLLWTSIGKEIDFRADWRTANRQSAHIAPDPKTNPEAIIQVYSARAYHWRGLFSVHTWIAVKLKNADHYVVYQIIGWRLLHGLSPLAIGSDIPDRYWFGNKPLIIFDKRGELAEKLIPKIAHIAESYPDRNRYVLWPGPNSNTFPAYVARHIPELGLALPPNALGKDFLPKYTFFSRTPSGTGYQFSLFGIFGISIAKLEGLEINILGLVYGINPYALSIALPGIGQIYLTKKFVSKNA